MIFYYYLLLFYLFVSFFKWNLFILYYFVVIFCSLYFILCCHWYVINLESPYSHHKLFGEIFCSPEMMFNPFSLIFSLVCIHGKKWRSKPKSNDAAISSMTDWNFPFLCTSTPSCPVRSSPIYPHMYAPYFPNWHIFKKLEKIKFIHT